MIRHLVCLIGCGLLAACNSVRYVGIDTYNPAEVTFPPQVAKVLIVNHAVPQPADTGHRLTLFGVEQDTFRIKADSALFDACLGLGKALVDAEYFNDVLLYHDAIRQDDAYGDDRKMTEAEVATLCEEHGADAIISFDRLLFETEKSVTALPEGYVIGMVDVWVAGVIRSYLPGREAPLASVYVNDSIFWTESADTRQELERILPAPDESLRAAGQYIAAKSAVNFVPHWEKETRWYFTGSSSRWKEAAVLTGAEKWEQAAESWERLYNNASGDVAKAKLASNLAFCLEMKGNLPQACEWADKAYRLFDKVKGPEDRTAQLLLAYRETLQQRIRDDRKLNIQFGAE